MEIQHGATVSDECNGDAEKSGDVIFGGKATPLDRGRASTRERKDSQPEPADGADWDT